MATALTAIQAAAEVYQATMEQASQQIDSRVDKWADVMTGATGKNQIHRQLGVIEMDTQTTRVADTDATEAEYYSRVVTPVTGKAPTIVDEDDQGTLAVEVAPTGSIAVAHIAAANRFVDRTFLAGVIGPNYEIDTAGAYSAVSLGSGQTVAVDYRIDGGSGNLGLTLAKLIRIKSIFGINEVTGQNGVNEMICLALGQRQLDDLLNNVAQIGSTDYNKVQALVRGEIDEFMGIRFIRTEQLTKGAVSGGKRTTSCAAWVPSRVHLDWWYKPKTSINIRPDKSNSLQVLTKAKLGVARKDEKAAVICYTEESA